MNRIDQHFKKAAEEKRKSLVLFLTAGYPDMQTTEALIPVLDEAGGDILELGVPFSDPIADGPTIQAASAEALKAGTTLEGILNLVERVREKTQMPIVLFGAYNPFLHYGLERLAKRAVEVGVDGFLVPDLPMEESAEFDAICREAGLALVYLVAPTTPDERMERIARQSTGFVYFISMKGVTGSTIEIDDALRERVAKLRKAAAPEPVAVGFGIQTEEHAKAIAGLADAVVVGSALIRKVDEHRRSKNMAAEVRAYVESLRRGVDAG